MWDITGDEMPEAAKGWGEEMIAYLPMTKSAVKGLESSRLTLSNTLWNMNIRLGFPTR